MKPFFYMPVPSSFGALGLVWQETEQGPKVQRVFLPVAQTSVEDLVRGAFVGARPLSCSPIAELGERLQPDDVVVGRLGWGWAGRRGLLAVEARHLRAGPTLQLGRRRREELPEFSCVGAFEVAVVGLVVGQCHVLC